jgi:hypothetical protein
MGTESATPEPSQRPFFRGIASHRVELLFRTWTVRVVLGIGHGQRTSRCFLLLTHTNHIQATTSFCGNVFPILRQIVLGRLKEIGQKFDRLFGRRVFPTRDTRIVIFRRPNGRLRGLAGRARRCGWLGLSKLILSAWWASQPVGLWRRVLARPSRVLCKTTVSAGSRPRAIRRSIVLSCKSQPTMIGSATASTPGFEGVRKRSLHQ